MNKDSNIANKTVVKNVIILMILVFITCGFQNPLNAMQVVAFYNCENFYDTTNQIIVNDEEFLPNSAKGYSASRYAQKTAQLGKVIFMSLIRLKKVQAMLMPCSLFLLMQNVYLIVHNANHCVIFLFYSQ
jgi:hypothetical protein